MDFPRRSLVCGLALVAAFAATPAIADQPGVAIRTAPLVDPATALTVYQNPTSPATATSADAGVSELARALRYDIDLIYEHVRDNVGIVPIYGLQRGARGAVIDENGTAFDQAQLMVELLREADRVEGRGYNPRYKLGRITLTGSQFADWFGISNADVARKVLADGGIPATVTGTGASFTSVTMSHIWVETTIGGSTYLFDPSYKPRVHKSKIDVPTIAGYNRTNLLNAGSSGATYSSTSISGFNSSSFNAQLNQYRSNLESYLRTNLPGRQVANVVGGFEILPHTATEMRRQSLPYASAVDATWTGEIPDVYRTTVTVTMGSGSNKLFADAIYGKQLRFTFGYNGSWYLTTGYFDNFSSQADECNWFTNPVSGKAYAVVSVAINHPYAALNGTYMDRTLSKQMTGPDTNGGCTGGFFVLTFDVGSEGTKRLSELRRQAAIIGLAPTASTEMITAPTLKNIPIAFSRYAELADAQLDLVTQIHDVVGVHNIDELWLRQRHDGSTYVTWAPERMLAIDFEAGISVNSRTDTNSARTEAGKIVASMGMAAAESAVPRQELDSVREISPLTLVTSQDTLAASPGVYRNYLANSANWTSIKASLSNYDSPSLAAITAYINDGYSILVPQRGDLTPGTYHLNISGGHTLDVNTVEKSGGSTFYRQAFFALRNGANGFDSAGLVTFDPRRGRSMKGGAGIQTKTPDGRGLNKPAVPQPETKDPVISALQVEPGTGALTYSPPADLTDGTGDLPYSLSLKRSLNSQDVSDIGIGIGWSHNWKNTVNLSSDTLAAFGEKGALGAATTLVAQQAAFDLASTGVNDPRTLLAILKSQQWLVGQSMNNVATVEEGLGGGSTFVRLASGAFAGVDPDAGLLVQTGAPEETMLNRWAYHPVSFSLSLPDGATRTYKYVGGEGPITDPAHPDLSLDIDLGRLMRKTFYMADWAFPTGVKIKSSFERQALIDVIYLYNLTNNLGNSISTTGLDTGEVGNSAYCLPPYNGQQPVYRAFRPGLVKYRDSAGNEVQFEKTASYHFSVSILWLEEQNGSCGTMGYLQGTYQVYAGNLLTASAPAASGQPPGPKWSYQDVVSGNGVVSPVARIYKPSNTTTPAAQVAYRQDLSADHFTDALSAVSTFRSAPHRLDTENPLGDRTATYVDQLRRTIRSVDELGNTSITTYNDAGQAMRTVAPEGNATEYLYDLRGNRTNECLIAKGRVVWASLSDLKVAQCNTALGDRATTTSYVEGPTLRMDQCVNLKTCNKPLYDIDAMGYRTDYSWDSVKGVLLSETHGLNQAGTCLVSGGTCPMTTYAYTGYSGTDGATVYLLTSKTEKISATSTTATTYTYDTANKFAPKTIVVDSGGLNLRTCGKFDAVGNLLSVSDPRQGVCP
jgi:YD repeat-containing protein